MIIETSRLCIREITIEDKYDLFEMDSNPEVQKYTGDFVPSSVEQVEDRIRTISLSDYKKYGFGRWAITIKENQELIGWAGLKYLPEMNKVDLGYRFKPEFWGKGYATEASLAIVEYGFKELKLQEIIAIAIPENVASTRVMEKVGMSHYKTAPYLEGEPDAVWYRIEPKT